MTREVEPIRRVAAPMLVAAHISRLTSAGFSAFDAEEWWPWDVRDYCLDAPGRMPAGSCWALVTPSGKFYLQQSVAYRDEGSA